MRIYFKLLPSIDDHHRAFDSDVATTDELSWEYEILFQSTLCHFCDLNLVGATKPFEIPLSLYGRRLRKQSPPLLISCHHPHDNTIIIR